MKSLQTEILERIGAAFETAGLQPLQKSQWANTGTVYGMNKQLQTVRSVSYEFQDGYASIRVRDADGNEIKAFHHLQYHEGDRIQELLQFISGVRTYSFTVEIKAASPEQAASILGGCDDGIESVERTECITAKHYLDECERGGECGL